ncbi:MAG: SDR family oxidoreductase [Rhodothermaceae bacterium]
MKTVLLTGANRGIGRAVALGFAEKGYKTILLVRDRKNLDNLDNEISDIVSSKDLEADIYEVDLTDSEKLKNRVNEIVGKYQSIDVLVNNAGVYKEGSLEIHPEEYKKVLEVNLVAPYIILQEVVEKMKSQKSGYIFNVSSRAGKIGFRGTGTYSSSKFGLYGLSESLYRDLTVLGIKVTTLCPSWVDTSMAREAGCPLQAEDMIQKDDIMKTINYLLDLSPSAVVKEIMIECGKNVS